MTENIQQEKQVNWEALYLAATRDITQLQHALRLMEMQLNELQGKEEAVDLPGEPLVENGKDKPKPN